MAFFRRKKRPEEAMGDPTSLGNVLMRLGYITPEQLKEAIQRQKIGLIGCVLVTLGCISEDQLQEAIRTQKYERGELKPEEVAKFHLQKQTTVIQDMAKSFETLAVASQSLTQKLKK